MRQERSASGRSRGSVLLVDDEKMLLEVAALALEGAGYSVATATSAVGLPELVRAGTPDVVVLDVGLPGVKGDRALSALREDLHTRSVRVILHSGECEEDLRRLAARSGADGIVSKGSSLSLLVAEVERAMTTPRPALVAAIA